MVVVIESGLWFAYMCSLACFLLDWREYPRWLHFLFRFHLHFFLTMVTFVIPAISYDTVYSTVQLFAWYYPRLCISVL